MYCMKCGTQVNKDQPFCHNCGANQFRETPKVPVDAQPHHGSVSLSQAIKLFLTNYFNFKGRASQSEFWFGFLFYWIVYCLVIVPLMVLCFIPYVGLLFVMIIWPVAIAMAIPVISLQFRRLHDVGKPGVYWLMGFIPVAGIVFLLIEYFKPSEGNNRWGLGPQ